MKRTIRTFCNFIVTISVVILVLYISFFTDIPTQTGNTIKLKLEEAKTEYVEYNSEFKINELGIKMNSYYYNKLTDDQKKIYESISNAVKNFETEFAVRDYVATDKDTFASEVAVAILAFTNDHPEVFYLKSQYSSYILSGLGGYIGYIKLNYTEENMDLVNEKLNKIKEKINEYTSDLDGLDDYEKELKIHDKLASTVTYSNLEDLPRAYHTIEGTLIDNIGVCDGFTKSLQVIYNQVGIDSIVVIGTLDNNPHAWNLVNLDGNWYNVDVTSSRSILDETGIINHAYFNLTNEAMKNFCSFDNIELLPETNSTDYNYYVHSNYVVSEDEDISTRLNEIYNDFSDKNYIEFYLEGDVSEKISTVLVVLKQLENNFLNGSKMYYYNIHNAIIIPKN